MQLLVQDLFKLPSLQHARIIAGKTGVYRPVSGATILEMTEMDRDNATALLTFSLKAQEALITALYNVRDNPVKQCDVIRTLDKLKAAGLIVFYYGLVVEKFDNTVLELCDNLQFPLIVLDHNENINVAYADVLNDIYSLRRHGNDASFQAAVSSMWRVKREGGNIRNALCQVSTPGQLDIAVVDVASKQLLCTTLDEEQAKNFLENEINPLPLETPNFELLIGGVKYYGQRHYTDYLETSLLLISRQTEKAIDADMLFSCVKLGIDFWRRELVLTRGDALVNAIVQGNLQQAHGDLDYYRQAEKLPWHFLIDDLSEETENIVEDLKAELHSERITYVEGHYERLRVILFNRKSNDSPKEVIREWLQKTEGNQLIFAVGLNGENELFRLLHIALQDYAEIKALYQGRQIIGKFELLESELCHKSCVNEAAWYDAQRLLRPLIDYDNQRNGLLLETLQVFLIDCDRSYKKTSKLMFTHQNTVQYRIKKAAELMNASMDETAALVGIYQALCIYRQNKQKTLF